MRRVIVPLITVIIIVQSPVYLSVYLGDCLAVRGYDDCNRGSILLPCRNLDTKIFINALIRKELTNQQQNKSNMYFNYCDISMLQRRKKIG